MCEQAAFAALYLGVVAIVAKSFARIHRTNLIAQGIPPLEFADESDYERAEQGQPWAIPAVLEAVQAGRAELEAETPAGAVPLRLRLTERERGIMLAGGLLAHALQAAATGSR